MEGQGGEVAGKAKRLKDTPDSWLPGQEKRPRKQAEAFKPSEPAKSSKIEIKQGKGTKLADIPSVHAHLSKFAAGDDTITGLHRLFYKTPGKVTTRKKALFQFSGFVFDQGDEDKERARVVEKLLRWTSTGLKDLLTAFGLPRGSGEQGTKENQVERIMQFLEAPYATEGKGKGKEAVTPKPPAKRTSHKRKKREEEAEEEPEEAAEEAEEVEEEGGAAAEGVDVDEEHAVAAAGTEEPNAEAEPDAEAETKPEATAEPKGPAGGEDAPELAEGKEAAAEAAAAPEDGKPAAAAAEPAAEKAAAAEPAAEEVAAAEPAAEKAAAAEPAAEKAAPAAEAAKQ